MNRDQVCRCGWTISALKMPAIDRLASTKAPRQIVPSFPRIDVTVETAVYCPGTLEKRQSIERHISLIVNTSEHTVSSPALTVTCAIAAVFLMNCRVGYRTTVQTDVLDENQCRYESEDAQREVRLPAGRIHSQICLPIVMEVAH